MADWNHCIHGQFHSTPTLGSLQQQRSQVTHTPAQRADIFDLVGNHKPLILLSSIIPLLVHNDQVGFVMGRQAWNSTRQYIDLIQWAENHRTPSPLLSLDAEKAFSTKFISNTCQRSYTNLICKGAYLTLSLVYIPIQVAGIRRWCHNISDRTL